MSYAISHTSLPSLLRRVSRYSICLLQTADAVQLMLYICRSAESKLFMNGCCHSRPGCVPTTALVPDAPVQLSDVHPSDVQLSDETFQGLDQLMDMMDDPPSNTLPGDCSH